MAKLIYSVIMSLDGYIADKHGKFDWSAPDDEVHAFVNDLQRSVGTYLYGRRMYGVMAAWQTMDDPAPVMQDFAEIWRSADKVVYSTTLAAVSTPRTRLEAAFDPDAVRQLKAEAPADITVAGPGLAAHAIRAGLVDEYQLLVSPVVVGAGNHFLPDDVRIDLELLDERRFANGVVFLRYRGVA